jgi:hypothetical protein
MNHRGACAHNMTVTELDFDGWTVTTFEEPVPGAPKTFDRVMALETPTGVALAIADAALNLADHDHESKAERALHAVVVNVAEHGIARGIELTAYAIHDPEEPLRLRNPMLTFAGIQIADDGRIEAFRCGDAEVWARFGDQWIEVLPGDMYTPEGRAVHDRVTRPGELLPSWLGQEIALDDLGYWASPAIGLDRRAHPRRRHISTADEVVLTSDGAQLNPSRLQHLEEWMLRYIHVMPENHPYLAAHGDLSVIRAVRDE